MLNSCFPDSFEQYPYSNLINYNIDPNQNQKSQISDYSKYGNQKKIVPMNVTQQNYPLQNTNRPNNSNSANFSNYPRQPSNSKSQYNNSAAPNNYPNNNFNYQPNTQSISSKQTNYNTPANQPSLNSQYRSEPSQNLASQNNYSNYSFNNQAAAQTSTNRKNSYIHTNQATFNNRSNNQINPYITQNDNSPTYRFNSQGNLQPVPNNLNSSKTPNQAAFNNQYNNQIKHNATTPNNYPAYNPLNQNPTDTRNNNFHIMNQKQNTITSNQKIRSNFYRNNRTIPRTTGLQNQDYYPEITKSTKSYYQKAETSNSLIIDKNTRKKFDLLDSNFFSLANSDNNIQSSDYPNSNNNIEQRFFEENLRLKEQINTDQLEQKNRKNLIPQI